MAALKHLLTSQLLPSVLRRTFLPSRNFSTGFLTVASKRFKLDHPKASPSQAICNKYCSYRNSNQWRHLSDLRSNKTIYRFLFTETHTHDDFTGVPLQKFAKNNDKKALEITWLDNEIQTYAYPWLRDNCRCESCYSHASHSRLVSFMDLDVEASPENVDISANGETLTITWPDGHISEYITSWLKDNRFEVSTNDPVLYPSAMRYWGKEIGESLRVWKMEDLLSSDEALYDMLLELKSSGLCCVKGGGGDLGQVKNIADRIGFLHVTYFG